MKNVMTNAMLVIRRSHPIRRLNIQRAASFLWPAVVGILVSGCEEPLATQEINATTQSVLVGRAMFVTDESGNATAAWLGRVKVSLPINDLTLAEVSALPKLTALYVNSKNVTDSGTEHVARMSQLEVLDLSESNITDRGLQRLETLKKLKVLCLGNTRVTEAGIEHFHREVPHCDLRR